MEYQEILSKINFLHRFGIKPGLENISLLLRKLGEPQRNFKVVHVAGTNGKGTVCNAISYAMSEVCNVGLFTSPHLVDGRERIKINNIKISEEEFVNCAQKILNIMRNLCVNITEFEFITALAFVFFSNNKIDLAVIETGLGGRLDATNIFESEFVLCSVITKISFDHMHILGDNLKKIASEKAGIIKKNSVVFVYSEQKSEVLDVLNKKCCELESNMIVLNKNNIKIVEPDESKARYMNREFEIFEYKNREIEVRLFGEYQKLNLLMALEVVDFLRKYFVLNNNFVASGLKKMKLHARFELIKKNPVVILDAAHNPDGAESLARSLEIYFANSKKICVFAVMSDKDICQILNKFVGVFEIVILPRLKIKRAADPEIIAKFLENINSKIIIAENVKIAYNMCLENLRFVKYAQEKICVIFGSFYLAAEILDIL